MSHVKLLVVAGARPNFMKVAPIIKELRARRGATALQSTLGYRLVHTGQHYDVSMSDVFFQELGIPKPDVNLDVGSGSHAAQTAKVMQKFEQVCLQEQPDWAVVVGDVNSTMACALVCSKLGIRVAHVEAGLRSFDRRMPEEINRIVTDALSDLLFTPSSDGDANLIREGIDSSRIKLVGNVMIDSLVANLAQARSRPVLTELGLSEKAFVYVTLHRPSNVDQGDKLVPLMAELCRLARQMPVVFPMHPRTRKMCEVHSIALEGQPGLIVRAPLGYHDSLRLTEAARFVMTDSGGLQEESTYFRTPCLTLRDNTERPITISVGSNRLTSLETLDSDVTKVLRENPLLGMVPPLWDGAASARIVDGLIEAA
jgi:UDP-N-acetylglucosamine 2-epimerase (non-hydrolysing)